MAKAKFIPVAKVNANGKAKDPYKAITVEEMVTFIKENGEPDDIAKFKKAFKQKKEYEAHIVNGKQVNDKPTGRIIDVDDDKFENILYAKEVFCTMYCPELLPQKKEKAKKKTTQDWLNEI